MIKSALGRLLLVLWGFSPHSTNAIVVALNESTDNTYCTLDYPDFFSYHIHVLFWPNNEEHTRGALQLRDAFIRDHSLKNHNCTMSPVDPAPEVKEMCVFPINMNPNGGPFLTAEYAFFIPQHELPRAQRWIAQHHGIYDVLFHPNTGCHVHDHTEWAMWMGNKWNLDTDVFNHNDNHNKPGWQSGHEMKIHSVGSKAGYADQNTGSFASKDPNSGAITNMIILSSGTAAALLVASTLFFVFKKKLFCKENYRGVAPTTDEDVEGTRASPLDNHRGLS